MTKEFLSKTMIELSEAMYLVQLMNDYDDAEDMIYSEIRKLSSIDNPLIKWPDGVRCDGCGYVEEDIVMSYIEEFKDIEYWEFRSIPYDGLNIGNVIYGGVPDGLQYEMNTDSYFDESHIKFAKVRCYKMCSVEGHLVVFFGMSDKAGDVLKTISVYG